MRKKEHLLNYLSLNQAKANKAAQDYNRRYNPLKHGLQKGLIDLTLTDNGGVSFKDSPYIYKLNSVAVYKKIKASSRRLQCYYEHFYLGTGTTLGSPCDHASFRWLCNVLKCYNKVVTAVANEI